MSCRNHETSPPAPVHHSSRLGLLVLAGSLLGASGCATIFESNEVGSFGRRYVTVTSTPPGAAVVVDGGPIGVTPARVSLNRRRSHELRLTLDGYADAVVPLRRSDRRLPKIMYLGFIGIQVATGMISYSWPAILKDVGVDAFSGAFYKLPESAHVDLVPTEPLATVVAPLSPRADQDR